MLTLSRALKLAPTEGAVDGISLGPHTPTPFLVALGRGKRAITETGRQPGGHALAPLLCTKQGILEAKIVMQKIKQKMMQKINKI